MEPGTGSLPGETVAKDPRPTIAVLGDSLTAGLGVDPAESYPSRLQEKLDSSGFAFKVVNAGVSGDTTSQGLNRLPLILDQRPAYLILALGANDGMRGVPAEVTRKNLDTIVELSSKEGARVILAGMLVPPNYGIQYARDFGDMFPQIARRYRLPLIPFLLEGVAGIPELNQSDGIHPTAEGHRRIAENVWKVLAPNLPQPR